MILLDCKNELQITDLQAVHHVVGHLATSHQAVNYQTSALTPVYLLWQ
jgi:hypothetical protein